MNRKPQQKEMFEDGQDLPLFSGACVRGEVSEFTPQPSAYQMPLFGRPAMTPPTDRKTVEFTGPHMEDPCRLHLSKRWHIVIRNADGSVLEGYNIGDYDTGLEYAQGWAQHFDTALVNRATY